MKILTNLLPGFAYHRELLAMTNAGIPPAAVLKAATIDGARALGIDARLGSIEAGHLATYSKISYDNDNKRGAIT